MAITASLTASESAGWNASTNVSTAAAIAIPNPGANALIVYMLTAVASPANELQSVTLAGGGYTWTRVGTGVTSGTFAAVGDAWWAKTTTDPGAGFTITPSGIPGGVDDIYTLTVHVITGHDTTTPIGGFVTANNAAGNGAVTQTLSAAPATDDITLAQSLADENTVATATFGTGTWSTTFTNTGSGKNQASIAGYRTGSTSTSVPWSDVNTGSDNFASTQVALVVKAAAGAADFVRPTVVVPTVAVNRAGRW